MVRIITQLLLVTLTRKVTPCNNLSQFACIIIFLSAICEQIATWHEKWDAPRLSQSVDDVFKWVNCCTVERCDFMRVLERLASVPLSGNKEQQ